MKIQKLTLEGFRGFKEKVEFDLHPNVNVFVGVNGSGKTSVLDAVGILLGSFIRTIEKSHNTIDFPLDDLNLHVNEGEISCLFYDMLSISDLPVRITRTREHSDVQYHYPYIKVSTPSLELISYYYKGNRTLDISNKLSPSNSLSISNFDDFIIRYIEIENNENRIRLRENETYRNPILVQIRQALNDFFSKIRADKYSDLYVDTSTSLDTIKDQKDNFRIDYKPTIFIKKNKDHLELNNLSDGEKMVILLVCDIALKLSVIGNDIPVENPLQKHAIILIDEIDLHLHPSWQRDIIPALTHVFPNVQFLVTTHSQQVLSNVRKESVHIIEDFKKVPLTPPVYGEDSNSILWDIFGVKERPEHAEKAFDKFYRLLENEDKNEASKVLEALEVIYGEEQSHIKQAKMDFELEFGETSEA